MQRSNGGCIRRCSRPPVRNAGWHSEITDSVTGNPDAMCDAVRIESKAPRRGPPPSDCGDFCGDHLH